MPRPRRQTAPGTPALSRERIAQAALDQLDAHGLAGFSLRDVARALGVYPTAIYWHVRNRNQLLADACALALAQVVPPRGKRRGQDWLRELFHRYRRVMKRHPHLAHLVGGQLLSNASLDTALIEGVLAALEDAGCPEDFMVPAYNAVIAALCGFPTLEFAQAPAEDADAWATELQQRVRQIPALAHPALARHLPALANRSFILRWQSGQDHPMDSGFDAYVDIFLAGLAQTIERQRPAPPRPTAARVAAP